MIEWDILSAADVSWSLDWVCVRAHVCVSIGVYQSLSHPGPILYFFIGILKQPSLC